VTLLGHLFPFFPFICTASHIDLPFFSLISIARKHPTTVPPPPTTSYHHHHVTTPLPIITAAHPITPITPISIFSPHFLTTPKLPKTIIFAQTFCLLHAQTVNKECACIVCVDSFDFAGGWVELGRGFETLVLKVANQMFVKKPQ
jgi:hypothetical protein